jgi:hypothetical protein
VAISGNPNLKLSLNIEDANDDATHVANDDASDDKSNTSDDDASDMSDDEDTSTRTEFVASNVERIMFGSIAKVDAEDKQHPLLAQLKNSDDKCISIHIIDGLLTEIYAMLGSDNCTINYTNNRNSKT